MAAAHVFEYSCFGAAASMPRFSRQLWSRCTPRVRSGSSRYSRAPRKSSSRQLTPTRSMRLFEQCRADAARLASQSDVKRRSLPSCDGTKSLHPECQARDKDVHVSARPSGLNPRSAESIIGRVAYDLMALTVPGTRSILRFALMTTVSHLD